MVEVSIRWRYVVCDSCKTVVHCWRAGAVAEWPIEPKYCTACGGPVRLAPDHMGAWIQAKSFQHNLTLELATMVHRHAIGTGDSFDHTLAALLVEVKGVR